MKSLPCSECTKTNNHCCLADIPHSVTDAIFYNYKAMELGIEALVVQHPSKNEGYFVLVDESMRGQDITKRNCIFLNKGQCSIYEDRPSICRAYGTECMPCRYEDEPLLKTKEQIGSLSEDDMHKLDSKTNMEDIFNKYLKGV